MITYKDSIEGDGIIVSTDLIILTAHCCDAEPPAARDGLRKVPGYGVHRIEARDQTGHSIDTICPKLPSWAWAISKAALARS